MKNLSDIPKDLLIKIILTVEKTVKNSLQSIYQKVYDRQQSIYDGINKVYPDDAMLTVSRCAFPNCKEIQVWGAIDEIKGGLNYCNFFCDTGSLTKHYCDAHDMLNYMEMPERVRYGGQPICEDCKPGLVAQGYVFAEKDITYIDKEKVERQLEEDKVRLEIERNKIPNYYAMSKEKLIHELVNIGIKTQESCEEEHRKELLLIKNTMQMVEDVSENLFDIHHCAWKGCENFMISGIESKKYHYKHSKGKVCTNCEEIYYCKDHLSHFPLTVRSKKGDKYFCRKCKIKRKQEKGFSIRIPCN